MLFSPHRIRIFNGLFWFSSVTNCEKHVRVIHVITCSVFHIADSHLNASLQGRKDGSIRGIDINGNHFSRCSSSCCIYEKCWCWLFFFRAFQHRPSHRTNVIHCRDLLSGGTSPELHSRDGPASDHKSLGCCRNSHTTVINPLRIVTICPVWYQCVAITVVFSLYHYQ